MMLTPSLAPCSIGVLSHLGRTDAGEVRHGEAGQGLRGARDGHQGLRTNQAANRAVLDRLD